MTREEALEVLIVKAGYGDFVKDIIDQIFDYTEAQLKAKDEEIAELNKMFRWMELHSNASLYDYYNRFEDA